MCCTTDIQRPDHQQSVVCADHQQSSHSPVESLIPHNRGDRRESGPADAHQQPRSQHPDWGDQCRTPSQRAPAAPMAVVAYRPAPGRPTHDQSPICAQSYASRNCRASLLTSPWLSLEVCSPRRNPASVERFWIVASTSVATVALSSSDGRIDVGM